MLAAVPNWTAARAMSPTAAAFRPVSSARTMPGSVSGIWATPRPRPSIPNAPGRDQQKNAIRPGSTPCATTAIENASCVEPGPGRALPRAKRSKKVVSSTHLSLSTNRFFRSTTCTPGPPKDVNPRSQ